MTSRFRSRAFLAYFPALLALLAAFPFTPALAADYSLAPRPPWLQPVPLPEAAPRPAAEGLRYLLVETQINLSGEKKERFHRVAMQPLNQQGLQQISSITLSFAPAYEELVIHDVSVRRDGERHDRLDSAKIKLFQREDELDRGLYAERWTAMLLLKDLRAGDIVEYSYTLRGANPVLGDKYFGREILAWGVPVERLYVGVLSPAAQPLQLRLSAGLEQPAAEIQRQREGDRLRYLVDLRNPAPVYLEDGMPEWLSPFPALQYSQYRDWRQVNAWAHALYRKPGELPQVFVDRLARLDGSPEEKAAAVTQWIQRNIRYFGIEHGVNSHRPSAPGDTFDRRFGDCKDKTVLLVAALRQLGIDAHPALVSSTHNLNLDERLPSPGNFDHVITTFTLEGKRYWVDPTDNSQSGTLAQMSLPDFNWALVVDGESDALIPIEAPLDSQRQASVQVTDRFILDDSHNSATLEVTSRYTGWRAEEMRSYTGYRDRQTLEEELLQYYSRYFPAVEVLAPVEIIDEDNGNVLVLKEKYRLGEIGDDSSGKNMLELVASSVVEAVRLPNARQRRYPFRLPGELHIEQTLEIVMREAGDLRWSEGVGTETLSNPWFEFSRDVHKEDNQITVEYNYESLRKSVSATDFSTYLEQIMQMDDHLSYVVWLAPAAVAVEGRRARARDLARDLLNGHSEAGAQ